jgi:hypothetical protein
MTYDELVHGYRDLFSRIYTWDAIGERWLANVKQWGPKRDTPPFPGKKKGEKSPADEPSRKWLQAPLGRFKFHLILATMMILKYYFAGGKEKRNFALKMFWGTLKHQPSAILQTLNYLAYFIHLREYADKVVAKDIKFNYMLDEHNLAVKKLTAKNLGETGHINMVKKEKNTQVKINVNDAYQGAQVTADVAADLEVAGK